MGNVDSKNTAHKKHCKTGLQKKSVTEESTQSIFAFANVFF